MISLIPLLGPSRVTCAQSKEILREFLSPYPLISYSIIGLSCFINKKKRRKKEKRDLFDLREIEIEKIRISLGLDR